MDGVQKLVNNSDYDKVMCKVGFAYLGLYKFLTLMALSLFMLDQIEVMIMNYMDPV